MNGNRSRIGQIEGDISTERQNLNNNALSQAQRSEIEARIQNLEVEKADCEAANFKIRAEIGMKYFGSNTSQN